MTNTPLTANPEANGVSTHEGPHHGSQGHRGLQSLSFAPPEAHRSRLSEASQEVCVKCLEEVSQKRD